MYITRSQGGGVQGPACLLQKGKNHACGIKESMPWISVRLWYPLHRISGLIDNSRIREKPLWDVLALPSKKLAMLRPLNPQVQPSFWHWNNLWFFTNSKFTYRIIFFPDYCHTVITSEERVALSNHPHSVPVVGHENDQVISFTRATLFQGSIFRLMKLPWKAVFLLRISSSLEASNCVLSNIR